MRLGFIGTGVITSALVRGLCTSNQAIKSVWVSPRNAKKAENLKNAFERVTVGRSNQDVIDNSDIVVIAILPQNRSILSHLKFRSDQNVVNLLAGTRNSSIMRIVKPARIITRVILLPSAEKHIGPIAIYPHNEIICEIFRPLGKLIVVSEEHLIELFSIITALMAPYFTLVNKIANWAVGEGLDRKNATLYTMSMFGALSKMAEDLEDGDLDVLIKESMTPGGINELALKTINENGGFENFEAALRTVYKKNNDEIS